MLLLRFSCVLPLVHSVLSQNIGSFSPASTVPYGVRSPYFNTWVINSSPGASWPRFWVNRNTGWSGLVRIDGVTYQWLGGKGTGIAASDLHYPTVTNLEVTPTRTIYTQQAGSMKLIITSFSPIEPTDLAKQSLPFSYLSFEASSTDGQSHSVQVFSSISAEWCTGNRTDILTWSTNTTQKSIFHTIQPQQLQPFTEIDQQAQDAIVYFTTPLSPNVTTTIALANRTHTQFAQNGYLSSPPFASPEQMVSEDSFALATDLGEIMSTESPIVWSLAVVRNATTTYTTGSGNSQVRYPYFLSQWASISEAIDMFLGDFPAALSRAIDLDSRIMNDSSLISPQYANLTSLAARQTIGGTEVTISLGTDGNWNTSDVMIFMKDVGNSGRVNPVEVLYASFPFFLYLNSSYCGQLLLPLLEYQDSPLWAQPYAAQDLGTGYPQSSGETGNHDQGVEQSGNMLIMALAHAQASKDPSLVSRYYDLLKGWANYLANNTLAPVNQATADLEISPNSTNLAIKGIIAIRAMAEISQLLGRTSDSDRFSGIASSYLGTWKSLALSPGPGAQHILANYGGDPSSWSLMYNLYADTLLQTQLVDPSILKLQTDFYNSLFSSVFNASQNGLPITQTSNVVNSAWTMLAAATVTNTSVRDSLISQVYFRATNSMFFPSTYNLSSHGFNGTSSPAQGAMFALLLAKNSSTSSPQAVNHPKSTKSIAPIIGGVVGGVALIAISILVICLCKRRNRVREAQDATLSPTLVAPYNYNPFSRRRRLTRTNTQRTALSSHTDPMSSEATPVVRQLPPVKTRMLTIASPSDVNRTTPTSSQRTQNGSRTQRSQTEGTSTSEVQDLRAEMENLRQAVREIQTERQEAPPAYHNIL